MEAIRRPQTDTQYTDKIINQAIEKTLEELKKNGKADNTIRTISYSLIKLDMNTDLHDPEAVKLYIARLKLRNNTKKRSVNGYLRYFSTSPAV